MTMKRNSTLVLTLGLLLLAAGTFLQITGGPPKADAALAQQCRAKMKDNGSDMVARCAETAFASGMTATDAKSAAQAISAANNREIGGNTLAMFLIGIGLVLLVGSVVLRRRNV
jgi:hypothetical protein